MIKVIAILEAKPGQEEAFGAALREVLAPTRAEDGCRQYDLYQDPETPTRFVFDEAWESKDHLAAHAKSEHIGKMREATKELVASRTVHVLERVA